MAETTTVRLPLGLLGFEQIKEFHLLSNPEEAPFHWLQAPHQPSLAFIVLDPFVAAPDYAPDIPDADARFLGLNSPSDALLYNIVTVHSPEHATVNLKGPIVVNRHTRIAKQVVLNNAGEYSVHHCIPVG